MIETGDFDEAVNQEPSDHQQERAHAALDRDQAGAKTCGGSTAFGPSIALLQASGSVAARIAPSRRQPAHKRREQRCKDRKNERPCVNRHLIHPRQMDRELQQNKVDEPISRYNSRSRSEDRDRQAFGSGSDTELQTAGAQRGSNRDFAAAVCGPREQQVRDVNAGNQQYRRDSGHQHDQTQPDARHHVGLQGIEVHLNAEVFPHVRKASENPVQLGACRLLGNARFQSRHCGVVLVHHPLCFLGTKNQWNP